MPGLEYQRLTVTGERHQRDVSQKCNQIGDATGLELDALKARVDTLETAIVQLRLAAQGAMRLATPVAGPDITGTFQPITFFDTIPYERGVTVNTTTGEFTFNIEGDWALWYRMSINHAGSGAKRTLDVQAFNVTDTVAGSSDSLFIGSNQEDTATSLIVPLPVTAGDVGDTFRLEIGNASTNITGVTWNSSNFLMMFVGELGSLAP